MLQCVSSLHPLIHIIINVKVVIETETKTLSKRIKELRIANNYTQDYVASELGVVRQTYSHYETGKRTPNSEMLYKLSRLYHIRADDLLYLTTEIDGSSSADSEATSDSAKALAAYLNYFNNPRNQRKYRFNTNLEKELLYYFQKITEKDKKEIIEFTKIKARDVKEK